MKRFLVPFLVIVAAATPVRAQQAGPADSTELARLVPAETLAILQWDDLGGVERWSKETALGKLWAEPEMQAFLRKLETGMVEAMRRAGGGGDPLAMFGLSVDDFRALEIRDGGFALVDVMGETGPVDLVMTMRFRGGAAEAGKIVQAVRGGLETFLGLVFEDVEIAGRKFSRIRPHPQMELVFGMDGERMWMATSTRRLEATLAAVDGPRLSALSGQPSFRWARERMGAQRFRALAWADTSRLANKLEELARAHGASDRDIREVDRVWKALGLDAMQSVAMADVPSGDGFRTEFAALLQERRGVFSLAQEGRPSERFTALAPANALVFGTERWDPAQGWESILGLVRAIDPRAIREMEDGLAEMRGVLGFDLLGELLASVGDEYAWALAVSPGGAVLPEPTVWIALKDAARFEKAVLRTVDALAPHAEREQVRMSVVSTEFRGTTIRFLEMGQRNGDPIPFAPAWALCGDHVVLGLWPQTVKHALMKRDRLAELPEFVRLRAQLPESTVAYAWIDSGSFVRWGWNSIVPLLQMVQGGLNTKLVPFEVRVPFEDLPTSDVITRHLGGMLLYSAVEDRAVRFGWISPYGMAGAAFPVGVLAGMGAVFTQRSQQQRAMVEARRAELEAERALREQERRQKQDTVAHLSAQLAERTMQLEQERVQREQVAAQLQALEREVAELRRLLDEVERERR